MCVIAYKAKGVRFMSERNVRAMWDANPHGAGVMWRDPNDGEIHFVKGFMKLRKLEEWIAENRSWLDEVECALHLRITTHGGTCPGNCHPFVVARDANPHTQEGHAKRVLMHNGILSLKPRREDISDTAELALRLGACDSPKAAMDAANEQFGGNRIILMDETGTHFYGDAWKKSSDKENEGIFYSNLNFEFSASRVGFSFASDAYDNYWKDGSVSQYEYCYDPVTDGFYDTYNGERVEIDEVDPDLLDKDDYEVWCDKFGSYEEDVRDAQYYGMNLYEYLDVKTEAESFGETVDQYLERVYGDPEEAEYKMAACS